MYRENGGHLIRLALRQSTFPTGEGLRRNQNLTAWFIRTTQFVGVVRPLLQSNRATRKTNDYRNQNGGRGNPSPTTKKPKSHGAAVCSHISKPSFGRKVPSLRGGRRARAVRCIVSTDKSAKTLVTRAPSVSFADSSLPEIAFDTKTFFANSLFVFCLSAIAFIEPRYGGVFVIQSSSAEESSSAELLH